ncbi:hypothetical protein M2444_005588 [Paenibacillus sp. PastF-3]|nr:hypothetical protein [Paenibacillus sp. PastF-3]
MKGSIGATYKGVIIRSVVHRLVNPFFVAFGTVAVLKIRGEFHGFE